MTLSSCLSLLLLIHYLPCFQALDGFLPLPSRLPLNYPPHPLHDHHFFAPARPRSLLPGGTIITDPRLQLLSHVVRIRSQSNGVGTGLLLKKNFVLTAKRVVQTFLDPFEFTIELGNASANGLDVFAHPAEDLAVIKIHPPIENTGRAPVLPGSPKGFFWPIADREPRPGSIVRVYGYGGTFSYGSKNFLSVSSFTISDRNANDHLILRTRSSIATTSGDAGGPGFFNNGSVLGAVVSTSKPRQGALISLASNRDWVFDRMKSNCSREEQTFIRLLVGNDPDILIYYHCGVDRAERLGVYLYSKPACNSGWKAISITDRHGHAIAMLEAHGKEESTSVVLRKEMFKSATEFYIQLWKAKFLGVHTKMATYGPYQLIQYMDGGLHFEWCATY